MSIGGRSGSMEVRTAAEARQKATQQLENLHAVVQNASGILAALSKVAERHLKQTVIHEQQQQQPTVASACAAAVVVQEDPVASQSKEHYGSKWAAANAVLLAMFLSGSGVGVYFGSVLLSANIV
ncbi:hypothetical protein GGI22_000574 [Coemansia erecta]|nr:hypothetical protein GGI22_000574 [Coemansia erecta]